VLHLVTLLKLFMYTDLRLVALPLLVVGLNRLDKDPLLLGLGQDYVPIAVKGFLSKTRITAKGL